MPNDACWRPAPFPFGTGFLVKASRQRRLAGSTPARRLPASNSAPKKSGIPRGETAVHSKGSIDKPRRPGAAPSHRGISAPGTLRTWLMKIQGGNPTPRAGVGILPGARRKADDRTAGWSAALKKPLPTDPRPARPVPAACAYVQKKTLAQKILSQGDNFRRKAVV